MKKLTILTILAVALSLPFFAFAEKGEKIERPDCHLSFTAPGALEYIETDAPIEKRNVICSISFNMKDKPKSAMTHGTISGWNEMVDFSLYVKSVSIDKSIKIVQSENDTGINRTVFSKSSEKSIPLKNGKLYVLSYDATHPTPSMSRLNQVGKVTFLAGDDTHSIEHTEYLKKGNQASEDEIEILTKLFSSIEFQKN